MDIKHREVVQWLEEVYGNDQIPPYEKSERSINILHQLMTVSKCSEKNAKLLAADYATKTAEYNAEGQQINKWLESVNIKPSILLKEGQEGLTAFATSAQVLDVHIPTSTNIILAANQLEMEHMQTVNEQEQERGRMCQLLELNKAVGMKIEEIRSIHKQAEATWNQQQEVLAKDKKQEYYVKEKRKDYISDMNYYEAKLNQVGMTKNIMHSTLCKQWAQLKEVEQQVSSLETKLKSYNLPPDMTLAEVKVEEARQKLASLMSDMAAACKDND
ncbi:hypothetical protein Pmani_023441 [Petrolisthes manimaculis]|uniref:HAUS augmin-like complex subunit 1 n=1 Tax=Petrolisthes manimaculis TaxID=1843537 RepID=A0AAE1P9H6_9EUCA|nr:hypothetical protein Pmani_023441 [Petrolisthes manimaculis]